MVYRAREKGNDRGGDNLGTSGGIDCRPLQKALNPIRQDYLKTAGYSPSISMPLLAILLITALVYHLSL